MTYLDRDCCMKNRQGSTMSCKNSDDCYPVECDGTGPVGNAESVPSGDKPISQPLLHNGSQKDGELEDADVWQARDVKVIQDGISAARVEFAECGGGRQMTDDRPYMQMSLEHTEYHKLQQQQRDREPLLLCKIITKHPKKAFALTLMGHLFFLILTSVLHLAGYDLFPLVLDKIPLDLRADVDFRRGLAWDYKSQSEVFLQQGSSTGGPQSTGSEELDLMHFLYHQSDGANILTPSYLKAIKDVEDGWLNTTELSTTFCYRRFTRCVPMMSILRFFDGSMASLSPTFHDPNFNNIIGVVNEAYNNQQTHAQFLYFLGADFIINSTFVYSAATRSILQFGWPLPGYTNTSHRPTQQKDQFKHYLENMFLPRAMEIYQTKIDGMEYLFNSEALFDIFIAQTVRKDFGLVAMAFIFIMIFVTFQTRSFWVGGFAVLSIFTGFCCANACYRILFDFRYFGIFNIMALFIILGIGADDVFVFYDTWRQTAQFQYKSVAHRLSDCYRRSMLAMLFTSLTTAAAFCVSVGSPFLAVKSFGVYAGTLVVVNFISVTVFFPCVVITHHLYWEKYTCCCCCSGENVANSIKHSQYQLVDKVIAFFKGPYYRFISHKVIRWILLVAYAAIFAVMAYFASTLQPNQGQIKFIQESTPLGRFMVVRSEGYHALSSDVELYIYLVWGLKEQDMDLCHHSDSSCVGVTVWDDTFDMNQGTAQQDMLSVCEAIRGLSKAEADALHIKQDFFTGIPEVECFITDMKDFYQSQGYTFPLSSDAVSSLMASEPSIYPTPLPNATLHTNYFEVALSYWLISNPANLHQYKSLIGEIATPGTVVSTWNNMTHYYGTKLRYVAMRVRTTIAARDLSYPEGIPLRHKWEQYMNILMLNTSDGVKNGFQCTPKQLVGFNKWFWLKVSKNLVISAMHGIAVGIAVAFPILIVATKNVIIGLMALVIIMAITTCVIGTIPAVGWSLGLLESMNLVLVVGLAVDYIVHLAKGYARSVQPDRLARTRDMLAEVGISVISGAATTLGASVFMLPSKIIFFTKFGVIIFATIGFSLIFALGLFPVMVSMFGPQNKFGSVFARC